MGDYKDSPGGRQDAVYTHDEGDGTFSRASAAHLRGWDATDGAWYRVPVDHATGALLTVASGAAAGGLTDTQLRASAVPVSLASLPALAAGSAVIGHVIVDTAPTTAVTGPLTDTQLRASAVPVSLAAETTKVIGTVNVAASQAIAVTQATAASLNATVVGVDTSLGATVTPKAASTWDVSDRAGRALGSIANTSFAVTNAGTFAVQAGSTQSGSWVLSGSDNVSTLPVSARTHNGFTHLYVRDPGVIAVLSELLWEIQQLSLSQED